MNTNDFILSLTQEQRQYLAEVANYDSFKSICYEVGKVYDKDLWLEASAQCATMKDKIMMLSNYGKDWIRAVKAVRIGLNCGLLEAKQIVDLVKDQFNQRNIPTKLENW